jgi:hypothetical protein
MLLGYQRFDPFCEKSSGIICSRIRTCRAQEKEFLVLQGFGCGAESNPILMVLIQLLEAFEQGNACSHHA